MWAVPTFPYRGLQYCGRFSTSGSLAILAAMRRASSRVSRLAPDRRRLAVTLVAVPLKLRIDIDTGNPGARTEDCPWS